MPMITASRDGATVTVTFANDIEARNYFAVIRPTINHRFGKLGTGNPVKQYHLDKGCCDGSDPSGCYQRKQQEEADARIRERVEKRLYLDNEYFGTEPSDGDVVFCPQNGQHYKLTMGQNCAHCGFVA